MGHIRVDTPNTNNKWVGFGLANVDTIHTLTRHEHDPLTRIATPSYHGGKLGECEVLIVLNYIEKIKYHVFLPQENNTIMVEKVGVCEILIILNYIR